MISNRPNPADAPEVRFPCGQLGNLLIRLRLVLLGLVCGLHLSALAAPRAEHVFIISIDGGKPAVMQRSPMPVLRQILREGAGTWSAQTIIPPITLPAHTSMLTGVPMKEHGITWNDWVPTNGLVRFPTIFAAARQAGFSTALFAGKEKFRHLLLTNSVDAFYFDKTNAVLVLKSEDGDHEFKKEGCIPARLMAANAARYILQHQPNLCFIHLADSDGVGHTFGWDSPEQIRAFAETDAALGVILEAIKQARLDQNSVVIITADHGGHGKRHGKNTPEDMTIPWFVWGKGVKENYTITNTVNVYDTAATALWLLEVKPLKPITGQPVTNAFK